MPAVDSSRPLSRHHPYTRDFHLLSPSQKSKIANSIIEFAEHRSGHWPSALKYAFSHTHKGWKQTTYKELEYDQLLRKISAMHTMAPIKLKAVILALVSRSHTQSQLQSYGFKFSSNQLHNSRRKAEKNHFQLVVKHTMPPSRQKKSASVRNLVIEYLTRFSNHSSINCRDGQVLILTHRNKYIYEILKKKSGGNVISQYFL